MRFPAGRDERRAPPAVRGQPRGVVMAFVIPNEGEVVWLRRALTPDAGDADPLHLHLYKNNFTPLFGSVLADFTECDFAGYAVADVVPANWPTPGSVANRAQSIYQPAPLVFTPSAGSQNAYGYYLTDNADSVVLIAERFNDAPQLLTPSAPGLVVLVIQLHSEGE
jgi:hypothetical protein